MKEIAIMKKLDHPNLVKLHEVIDDGNQKGKIYVVMDYIPVSCVTLVLRHVIIILLIMAIGWKNNGL